MLCDRPFRERSGFLFDLRAGVPGDSVTLREWVERFVAAPASADTTWRIDGLEGAVSGCAGHSSSSDAIERPAGRAGIRAPGGG